ncbi:MAG: rod shape-determining protein MreC [bacterium]
MRDRGYLVLLALGVALLIVVNLPATVAHNLRAVIREGLAPYQAWAARALHRADRAIEAGRDAECMRVECVRLRHENEALRTRVRNSASLDRRNLELSRLLGRARELPDSAVACEVIARDDGGGWWQAARLDRGASSGLSGGQAVITADGLIGRIRDVSNGACDVLLLSDRSSRVAVRFVRSGVPGILTGGGLSPSGEPLLGVLSPMPPLTVEYTDRSADLRTNDLVVTSGLGGVFPADLPVGVVRRIEWAPSRLYRMINLEPCADLTRVRYVLVLPQRNAMRAPAAESLREDATP